MSESEYVPFSDPRRLFSDGARAKRAHREHLGAIFAPREPGAAAGEAALDALADAVAGRIVARVRGAEPEPEAGQGGFDGGARPGQPHRRPKTHAETLIRLLRDRSADRGASF
jgi:hypothetical protein